MTDLPSLLRWVEGRYGTSPCGVWNLPEGRVLVAGEREGVLTVDLHEDDLQNPTDSLSGAALHEGVDLPGWVAMKR